MFNYNLFLKHLSNRKNSNNNSFVKAEIADRLLKRLNFIKLEPQNILILGFYNDEYSDKLKKRFPDTKIHTFNSSEQSYDIIISNTCIHLTTSIIDELEDYHDILTDNGILLFSTFGDKSFKTLNQAFEKIDNLPHTNTMIDLLTWGNTLQKSSWKDPAIESDIFTLSYKKTNTFFNDLRELHEPLADTEMRTTLTGKNRWQKLLNEINKNLVLEIEALYGYATKEHEKRNLGARNNDSGRISLTDLKKQFAEFKKNI